MGRLAGKVIVITGASRGIGEAMAIGYAREGAQLVLSARTAADLDRVAAACKDAGAQGVTAVVADVTKEQDVEHLVGRATEIGTLDVFVANAGTSYAMLTDKRMGELPTWDADIARTILDVNVIGAWLCMKHALPVMAEGASFIAVGSETGKALRAGSGFYALSKTALHALVTMCAREQQPRGVRVNALSPGGMVDTQLFGPSGMPDFLKQMHPPLPADVIVPAAIWLASDESKDVTGAFVAGSKFDPSAEQAPAL